MPDLRMYVVGEIERRCSHRQVHDVPFRCDRVDPVFEDVVANLFEKVAVALGRFEELAKEVDLLVERADRP